MSHNKKNINISNLLPIIVKIGMLLGGAWFVFSLFSEISMNVLQRTEYIHKFTAQYILDISLNFAFQISLAVMLIISAILGVSKFLNLLWTITGGIYVINVLYSIYKYLWYSVNFFKNYNFSFDGVIKIIEFLLYLSFVCSLVLICLYCGNIVPEKFKKIVSILSLIGTIYLFYMLVVSLFKGGDLAYIDILKNAFNFIGYSSIYAYGFVVDHTPKKDMIQDEIVAEIEVGNSSKLEKISSLVDELLEADSTNDELMTSEFETVSENLAEARDLAGDELISVDDESLVSNVDLPFMSGEFSFDKDENIINSILEEICEKVFLDTLDEKLSFDDVSTTSSDDVHCVESKTLSDIDE